MRRQVDNLTEEELKAQGYVIESDGKEATHVRYNSYRWKCKICGKWFKNLINEQCHLCSSKKV